MSSMFGENIKISIFGQSHSEAIGVSIDGLPSGVMVDMEELHTFLASRAPGSGVYSTKRREPDAPEFISGLVGGVTCGAPVTAIIRNTDSRSADYDKLRNIPRPSHADFTANLKYGGYHDIRGGGHFSGRLTAPLCVAGGICLQILRDEGIEVAAHIASIRDIADETFDPVDIKKSTLKRLKNASFPTLDEARGREMLEAIESARADGDSLGGVIECAAIGVPGGLGEPMFDGMENRIASIVFGVPAVRGIEFGSGFAGSGMLGSENNDGFYMDGKTVRTSTNNHGGILGGITSGMPVIFRAAIKPTPSIAKGQESVSLSKKKDVKLTIIGRHDPCIVPRAVPCIKAAAAIALYDALLAMRRYS